MEALPHMMPPIKRMVEAHEVDIHNVIHQEEELGLRSWRLRNQFVHVLQRWHVWSFRREVKAQFRRLFSTHGDRTARFLALLQQLE